MPKGRHPPHLVLGRRNFARLLYRLASVDTREAQELYVRLAGSWGRIPGRVLITVKPTPAERAILRVVSSRSSLINKESSMATKSKVSKSKVKPVEDDIDELEAELEGLEEVPDEDEAPEVEEDDDDEGEDYASLTSAQLKALCKERGVRGITAKNKVALIAMLEANDEESDDDEDDEEDEVEEEEGTDFEAMDRSELKAFILENDEDARFKKSQTDDDLREIASAFEDSDDEDEDDDDEEDDEEPEPTPKAKAKKGGPKKGVQPEGLKTRVLPKGKLSAADIAELMGTSALNVRNFLRSEAGQKWPIDSELGRYSFSSVQVKEIVKAMKARPPRAATVSGEEFKARMAAGRAKKAAATTKPAAVKGKKKRTA